MSFTWSRPKRINKASKARTYKINSVKELVKLSLPYKNKIILSCVCVLLINASQLLKPYLLKLVIDDFLIKRVVSTWFLFNNLPGRIIFTTLPVKRAFLLYPGKSGQ